MTELRAPMKLSAIKEQPDQYGLLFAKRTGLIKPGLDRVRSARRQLGTRDAPYTIQIGGTNGKGTTAAMLDRLLQAMGERTGLYTSPHLSEFRERYCLAGVPVNDAQIKSAWQSIQSRLPHELYEELSFFEIGTLIAWELFAEAGVNTTLLEVGMGGRWDTTNAVDGQLVILTNVGLDHQEFLGETVAKIAREKAGLMKEGQTVLWGGGLDPVADGIMRTVAEQAGAQLYFVAPEPMPGADAWLDGRELVVGPDLPGTGRYPLPDPQAPTYLRHNHGLALCGALIWAEEHWSEPATALGSVLRDWAERAPAARPCEWGRFQRIDWPGRKGPTILDVAHNAHAARALAAALAADGPWHLLLSVLADKDLPALLEEFAGISVSQALVPATHALRGRIAPLPGLAFHPSWDDAIASVPPAEPLLISGSILALAPLHQWHRQ